MPINEYKIRVIPAHTPYGLTAAPILVKFVGSKPGVVAWAIKNGKITPKDGDTVVLEGTAGFWFSVVSVETVPPVVPTISYTFKSFSEGQTTVTR